MDNLQDISISALLMRDRWLSLQYEYTVSEFKICSLCQMTRRSRITCCGEPEKNSFSQMHISLEVYRTLLIKISLYLKINGKLKVATKYDCLCILSTLQVNHFSSLNHRMNVNVLNYFLRNQALRKGTR